MKVWQLAVALTALLAAPAAAQTMAVVTGSDYAPFADERLPGGGLATEIVVKALAQEGATATVEFAPWKRGYTETLNGKYVATFPYVPTDERKAEMSYSEPIVKIDQVVYSTTEKPVKFASVDDLKGKVICSPNGYATPPAIDELIKGGAIRRETPAELDNCGKMVLAGRADFMIGDKFTVGTMFNRIGAGGKVVASEKVLNTTYLHLIAGKNVKTTADVIAKFNAGLKKLQATGEYDRIMAKATGGS